MNWARSFNANKISIAAAPTDQILPAANDRMAERGMDRISFDDTAPSQQEYRAAGTRGGGLPGRQHSALELGENEVPDLRRVIAVDQKLDPGLVLVGGAHGDEIGVGSLGIFAKDRILDRIEAGLRGVVGIDRGGIHIVQGPRRLRGIHFNDLELPGIFDDVCAAATSREIPYADYQGK